jgi:hypothetical protein
MADTTNTLPPFPTGVGSLRASAPISLTPTNGPPGRGVEGLRPLGVVFPFTQVVSNPENTFQPIACLTAYQKIDPQIRSGNVSIVDGFDRVTWWLMALEFDGPPGTALVDPPPTFELSLRAAGMGVSEEISQISTSGQYNSYNNTGLIVQVAGLLCSQWELWARVDQIQVLPNIASSFKIRVAGLADRMGNAGTDTSLQVVFGSLFQ